MVDRYGYSTHRHRLLTSLKDALDVLSTLGCKAFYLDGSFVTEKQNPGDYDGCWEAEGVNIVALAHSAPLLWDDRPGRRAQNARFGGDLFPVRAAGDAFDRRILDDFQRDPVTGEPKGIILLKLEAWT